MVNDTISRQAAIDAVKKHYRANDNDLLELIAFDIERLPSVQPEITDEQAILHLHSTGWMQNHDREMYEGELRKQLEYNSGGYDSLIPCKDIISRQAAIDVLVKDCKASDEGMLNMYDIVCDLKDVPFAQPEIIRMNRMRLINLTRKLDGANVYVNPEQICAVYPYYKKDTTVIQFAGEENFIEVVESADSIAAVLQTQT